MDRMDPEVAAKIHVHVAVLAAMDYPKVWVGEYGMTADELLALQELNEELPEYMRVEPGEAVEIGKSGSGVTMPGVSVDWIDGLWALCNLPDLLMAEGVFAELESHVMEVWAAKNGMVRVVRSWSLAFDPIDEISSLDVMVAKAITEDGYVMVPGVPEYDLVPIESLAPEDVDDDLLERLEFWASGEQVVFPGYVVGDTPRARAAIEARLKG